MSEGIRLAPLPKGYINQVSNDMATNQSITVIYPDGRTEYWTPIPKKVTEAE